MNLQTLTKKIKSIINKPPPYLTISIILLLLISVVLYQNKLPTPENKPIKRIQQEYMTNLTVTHFTETGTIKDQIYANHWAYIPTAENSILTKPKMQLNKPNGATWIISSNHAKAWHKTLDSKISKLDLNKDVIIERLKTNEFVPIIMKTKQLSYFPDTEFVETNQYVAMEKPGFQLSGIGLKAYLDKDLVQLLNNVSTDYETNSP